MKVAELLPTQYHRTCDEGYSLLDMLKEAPFVTRVDPFMWSNSLVESTKAIRILNAAIPRIISDVSTAIHDK